MRPWSQTMVSEGARPWGRGRSVFAETCVCVCVRACVLACVCVCVCRNFAHCSLKSEFLRRDHAVQAKMARRFISENPRAHKNKIGTFPPHPKNLKYPHQKRGILWTWRFSCRKSAIFPGAQKNGAAISGPRIAGKHFYGHEDFSDSI